MSVISLNGRVGELSVADFDKAMRFWAVYAAALVAQERAHFSSGMGAGSEADYARWVEEAEAIAQAAETAYYHHNVKKNRP